MYMQVLYRSLLTLILCHAHGDALPARVGAALEAEILKVCALPILTSACVALQACWSCKGLMARKEVAGYTSSLILNM